MSAGSFKKEKMHEFVFTNPKMKTWLQIHQLSHLMNRAENNVFLKLGLRKKRHTVLFALKNLKSPVTVTDIARWLDRNSNGISMLVNRMLKEGLIDKVRDMPDQREVRLVITKKGEEYFEEGKRLNRELIQSLFSEIADEDLQQIAALLENVRDKTLNYLKMDKMMETMQVLDDKENS